jgi:hypothetical protein
MRPLSATECISPAIERIKLVLFTPFRKGRTWKLCGTAYLCRAGVMFFPCPLIYLAALPWARQAGMTAAILLVVGTLLFTVISVLLFYLCSRLQFAFFDIVINRGEFVAPAWRKYGRSSLSWTGFKLLIGTLATLVFAVPIAAFIRHLIPLFQAMLNFTPGQPPPLQFMAAFYGGYAVFIVVMGGFYIVSSLLGDFVLPSLALEDTGLSEAFRRMMELIRREPGEFFIYTLLKLGFGFAAYMGVTIAWEILFVILTLIVGTVVFLFGLLLHLLGVPPLVLSGLAFLIVGLWYLFLLYSIVFPLGAVLTFLDAYADYFLGGRYPMLGDLLDRSTPPARPPYYPPYYPPPPPSIAGRNLEPPDKIQE